MLFFNYETKTTCGVWHTCHQRHPTFLPKIVHEFAEQLIQYQLIKLINKEKCSIVITAKVHTHSFYGFKVFIKINVINSYIDNCEIPFCESCQRAACRENPVVIWCHVIHWYEHVPNFNHMVTIQIFNIWYYYMCVLMQIHFSVYKQLE